MKNVLKPYRTFLKLLNWYGQRKSDEFPLMEEIHEI